MRKTELSNEALLIAVEEMSNGLIDANLGGDVIKNVLDLLGEVNAAESEQLLSPIEAIVGFLSMALKKTLLIILVPRQSAVYKI